jgi:DNA-binding transcriptional regulator/RsmH inhibitor MraZ
MTIWWLILILGAIGSAGIAFIWLAVRINKSTVGGQKNKTSNSTSLDEAAQEDVEHIFNSEFREELRNRGRLHFEKIIGENAMFLQQDLRLTTSQLNEYMKNEISRTLKEEFAKYEQSITDAKKIAVDSIEKTNTAIEEQRQMLGEQIKKEFDDSKRLLVEHFIMNMADIVNHYVLTAVGNQIDLSEQLDYILADLEANKQAILEDIEHGA